MAESYFTERVCYYDDDRFSQKILNQHGAFTIGNIPVAVEIISSYEARVEGAPLEHLDRLIDRFRFYAEHITTFYDMEGNVLAQFEPVSLFKIPIDEIQPSVIVVSVEKKAAVRTFVKEEKDVIIPVCPFEGRYLMQDGHSRISVAAELGFTYVYGFLTEPFGKVCEFARAVQKHGIRHVKDLREGTRGQFESQWYRYLYSEEDGGLQEEPSAP